MAKTKIEWADYTFNPWEGCQKVSPGCDNCYAEARNQRFSKGINWGPGAARRRTSPSNWAKPIRWDRDAQEKGKHYRVFCASLADVFDNAVPQEWRDDLWQLIRETPHLDWMILTKRPQNIIGMMPVAWRGNHFRNVWLGATVENQKEAERRILPLLTIPATRHFISYEPALGPVDFTWVKRCEGCYMDTLAGLSHIPAESRAVAGASVDLIICGGESGPNAKPMHPDWARSVRDQCKAAGVAFFFKQWGEWSPDVPPEPGKATCVVCPDGEILTGLHMMERPEVRDAEIMIRIGKKLTGNMLDGKTHMELPESLSF